MATLRGYGWWVNWVDDNEVYDTPGFFGSHAGHEDFEQFRSRADAEAFASEMKKLRGVSQVVVSWREFNGPFS